MTAGLERRDEGWWAVGTVIRRPEYPGDTVGRPVMLTGRQDHGGHVGALVLVGPFAWMLDVVRVMERRRPVFDSCSRVIRSVQ